MSAQGNGLKGQRLGENSNPIIYALNGQYKYLIHASMSQSLSKMNLHAIFHVKNNECLIRPEDEKELYAYMGGLVKLSQSIPIIINGMDNHVHVLCIMSKNISLSDLMEEIKTDSSR